MSRKTLSEITDKELMVEAGKIKPSPIIDAFFIGFLVGIVIYSVAANAWGFITLIPLFLIYLLLKKSRRYDALQREMKQRNLQDTFDRGAREANDTTRDPD